MLLKKIIKEIIGCMIAILILSIFFGITFHIGSKFGVNPPVVRWSVSKDQCIKVTNPPIGCDCENLPVKYERIWVK